MGIQTKGESGPIAWEATDLRLVQRTVEGIPAQRYGFTLILKETQGRGITFTHAKYIITALEAELLTGERTVDWELRPHGELRRPFSCGIKPGGATGRDFRLIGVAWTIILTGTDDQDAPVRVSININLPSKPPVKQATLTAHPSTAAHLTQPTIVPVSFVSNVILVSVTLAGKERATLLLDTGASRTAITPDMARQLGISPSDEAPRKTLVVFGGRKIEVPFVELSSIQVGDALVRNLEVGVSVVNPDAPMVDGVLGGDFLRHFKVTVDRAAGRLKLEPLSSRKGHVNARALEKALSEPTSPKRTAEEPSIRTQEKRLTYIPKELKDTKIPAIKLRSTPKPLVESDIENMIGKHNFYVRNKNEIGEFPNDFVNNGDGTITDRTTGLMWEKGGSSSAMRYWSAKRYVSRLNKEKSGGYNDWRIPTTEELASLLECDRNNRALYIAPLFDVRQKAYWTSDTVPTAHAGLIRNNVIDFSNGTIDSTNSVSTVPNFTGEEGQCFIRAVRSTK
jgi:hypothetical protein